MNPIRESEDFDEIQNGGKRKYSRQTNRKTTRKTTRGPGRPKKSITERLRRSRKSSTRGAKAGHPFFGNQWMDRSRRASLKQSSRRKSRKR